MVVAVHLARGIEPQYAGSTGAWAPLLNRGQLMWITFKSHGVRKTLLRQHL